MWIGVLDAGHKHARCCVCCRAVAKAWAGGTASLLLVRLPWLLAPRQPFHQCRELPGPRVALVLWRGSWSSWAPVNVTSLLGADN